MKSVQIRLSPPKLRLDLFFIPEFRSSSSSPSAGDMTPASQPIMAGTFSRRNWGKTPVRRETRQRVQSRSALRRRARGPAGETHRVLPKLWAFSMKQCKMAACSLRRFSVLAFIFSVPSPAWRMLGAKITDKLLLSILFSALLRSSRESEGKPFNVYEKDI